MFGSRTVVTICIAARRNVGRFGLTLIKSSISCIAGRSGGPVSLFFVSRVHVHRVHGPSAPAPRASGARRGDPVEPIGGRAQLILVVSSNSVQYTPRSAAHTALPVHVQRLKAATALCLYMTCRFLLGGVDARSSEPDPEYW
jgi:hypothetical protein